MTCYTPDSIAAATIPALEPGAARWEGAFQDFAVIRTLENGD
jgi:hypothetical protein